MKSLRATVLGVLVATCAALLAAPIAAGAAAPLPSRWVAVSVATLWVAPDLARPMDAAAGANPSDPRGWVAGMSVTQKRWLVGKLETQVLCGTHVDVLAVSGAWSKVLVPSQPTPRDPRGYPGWMRTAQLTQRAPAEPVRVAVIRSRTAWTWATPALNVRVAELSYATRLPAVAWTPDAVEVVLPDGRHCYLRRAAAELHAPGASWPKPSGAALVTEAKRFLGLQYLWAGTSGFGFDCSGFTHSVYRALGVTIPRDAAPQYALGARVTSRSALRAGDLVFFRNASGAIHHVGMYVGAGQMIHAPGTGQPVQVSSISGQPYAGEFAGGRRYVP